MSASSHRPVWMARPVPDLASAGVMTSPDRMDAEWLPLTQSWPQEPGAPALQPGWARIRWHETALHYDAIFLGGRARNTARQLNERTWELGDVGEIFVQGDAESGSSYLEVHVTPENTRLQLHWPPDGLMRVRSKAAPLSSFMISEPDWVRSQTHRADHFWAFHVVIPAGRLGVNRLHPGQSLCTAVCRYDYRTHEPALSSTAPLPVPFFHQRESWHSLQISN